MKEDIRIKLDEIKAKAEELASQHNSAMIEKRYDEVSKIDNDLTEMVNEYTFTAQKACFDECEESGNPMLEAVRRLVFETIAAKDEKIEDSDLTTRVIVTKERQIDLAKLHKHCNGIGVDKNWQHVAMKMNFLLTAQKCVDLGVDPKQVNDSYEMSEIAKALDMGKTPTSRTNMLKTLQMVVNAMIGEEYKATSHDVRYLLSIYARKKNNRALTVACASHRFFRNYLAEICHRIVTNASYNVEFNKAK